MTENNNNIPENDLEDYLEENPHNAVDNIYGLVRRDVMPDGRCLFNSISMCLAQEEEHKKSPQELTQLASDEIRKNEYIKGFLDLKTIGDDLETYLTNLSTGKQWGGEPEIAALEIVLQRDIIVVNNAGRITEGRDIEKNRDRTRNTNKERSPIFVYYSANHYQALLLTGESTPAAIIAALKATPAPKTSSSKSYINHEYNNDVSYDDVLDDYDNFCDNFGYEEEDSPEYYSGGRTITFSAMELGALRRSFNNEENNSAIDDPNAKKKFKME